MSLTNLPNILKWNISKVKNMKDMFFGCNKIINLIPIRFKTKGNHNILDFTHLTKNTYKGYATDAFIQLSMFSRGIH